MDSSTQLFAHFDGVCEYKVGFQNLPYGVQLQIGRTLLLVWVLRFWKKGWVMLLEVLQWEGMKGTEKGFQEGKHRGQLKMALLAKV